MGKFAIGVAVVALGLAAGAKPTFIMPPKVYAVPGIPCNVYYAKLFGSVTPQRYLLESRCPVGSGFSDCWRFTPDAKQGGKEYRLVLNAWDDDGLVAAGTTTVVVAKAPTEAEKSRRITLALLAASDVNCFYQDQVLKRMREAGYDYVPVGNRGGFGKDGKEHAKHDGYGGYDWAAFATRYAVSLDEINNLQSDAERHQLEKFGIKLAKGDEWRKYLLKSPLVRIKNGERVLDIPAWFDKINGGEAPDYIVISLGGNNVFDGRPGTMEQKVAEQFRYAKLIVPVLRKAAPKAIIALTSPVGGSFDQDSWGRNYGTLQNCYFGNRSFLCYAREAERFCRESGDDGLVFVPVSQGVDPVGSYYKGKSGGNALHPTEAGGQQIGDIIYAWLVNSIQGRN